ncbi:hypothetical protein [Sphingomonas bacterium]|uniref:hypothetical protein n=1 Tax=Sphingomonas bacterium TaxID=1895847 RepID=UPI00157691B9|nr:hypothetical protein [Sphingomonas bacterium]
MRIVLILVTLAMTLRVDEFVSSAVVRSGQLWITAERLGTIAAAGVVDAVKMPIAFAAR